MRRKRDGSPFESPLAPSYVSVGALDPDEYPSRLDGKVFDLGDQVVRAAREGGRVAGDRSVGGGSRLGHGSCILLDGAGCECAT